MGYRLPPDSPFERAMAACGEAIRELQTVEADIVAEELEPPAVTRLLTRLIRHERELNVVAQKLPAARQSLRHHCERLRVVEQGLLPFTDEVHPELVPVLHAVTGQLVSTLNRLFTYLEAKHGLEFLPPASRKRARPPKPDGPVPR